MTDTEFARVRRTALERTSSPRRRAAAPFTRSRVAITSMLAAGALMSSGGAALGVSALSTDLTARAAQYGTTQQTTPQTLAAPVAGPEADTAAAGGAGGVSNAPAGGETNAAPAGGAEQAAAQAPRQLEASERSELPFTGYVAIPLLLGGLALLAGGCVLRRGVRSSPGRP